MGTAERDTMRDTSPPGRGAVIELDVNYVNVNAFYFYFTPIMAEIDVKDIFYLLLLKLLKVVPT